MKKIIDELGIDQTAFDEPGPDPKSALWFFKQFQLSTISLVEITLPSASL